MPDTTFYDAIPYATSGKFDLPEMTEIGTTGASVRVREIATPIWSFDITMSRIGADHGQKLLALRRHLGTSSFLAWDRRRPYPKLDLDGSILGSATVQIKTLNADTRRLSLKGLPTAYTLSNGDYLSFTYTPSGGSGTHYALHQIVFGTVSDGSGNTSEFYVVPPIRGGAAVNAVVTLKKPVGEFIIKPSSFDHSTKGVEMDVSFKAVQVV